MKISEVVQFVSGTPQFRIRAVSEENAPRYWMYSRVDLTEDLTGVRSKERNSKIVRTWDEVEVLVESDVLFSLVSGEATIIRQRHVGYLFTQNYLKMIPNEQIAPRYLVYLLNQDRSIRRQLALGLQGSMVLKYTLAQIKELELPNPPTLAKQEMIGDIYFKQLRLQAMKKQVVDIETAILFQKLGEMRENG